MTTGTATLHKAERLNKRSVVKRLFDGKNKSVSAFPLRVVYMPIEEEAMAVPVSILISVPKRYFKHAVDRNRVKRQIRESYRKNKQILICNEGRKKFVLAFLWLDKRHYETCEIESRVKFLLHRIAEKTDTP